MTNDEIIRAAFKVWGRDFYRTTSLTDIARELGVSKPALYRHFKYKDALLDAMYAAFFNDSADFLKSGFEKAVNAGNGGESQRIWMRALAEYYVRNREALVFSLIRVYNSKDRKSVMKEYFKRGIDFSHPALREKEAAPYPPKMQLAMATLIFCVANFHHHNHGGEPCSCQAPALLEEQVKETLAGIEGRITGGLGLDADIVVALNYRNLEQRVIGTEYEETETNALLRAAAEAVAEAGPWDASMEMVARHSGLSKSGLYAHFKNKQDMMAQLFITEFSRIVNSARMQIETSIVPEEQLYLAIISIVDYLRSRPEILVALDWIKTRDVELGKEVPGRLYRIINDIKLEAIRNYDQHMLVWAAQWILFMIINTLAWWPQIEDPSHGKGDWNKLWAKKAAEIPNESFRILFRFIALGLKGADL